jgi:hypothetical protein
LFEQRVQARRFPVARTMRLQVDLTQDTLLALILGTILSATAWRARSWLVQWVICNPLAIGSRQASCTI